MYQLFYTCKLLLCQSRLFDSQNNDRGGYNVGSMGIASTTTRVQFSPLSGPISTRVATRTTTVNKFCSTCVGTKSVMERPPGEWGIEDIG